MSSNSESTKPKRSWFKSLLQNLAIFGATFLFCVIVTELVLRIMGYGNLEIYEPDPLLYWRLKPNQTCHTKVNRKLVHINSHGTRGPDFEVPKPPGTVRILSLGDSRTFGWGLSDEETYSSLIEAGLRKTLGPSQKIEVINCGVNAWSYPQMTAFFRDRTSEWRPDIVLLADANLWTQFSEKNSPEFVRKFMWRVRLKNFLRRFATYHFFVEAELNSFYARYRTKFIPVDPKQDALFKEQQQSDPDAFFRDSIEELCRQAKARGVRVVLCHLPVRSELETGKPGDNVLNAKLAVAKEFGVPCVDLAPDLKSKGGGTDLYLEADPVHFNATGNKIIANSLVETIAPLIKP